MGCSEWVGTVAVDELGDVVQVAESEGDLRCVQTGTLERQLHGTRIERIEHATIRASEGRLGAHA
jgi:hypothetical protein